MLKSLTAFVLMSAFALPGFAHPVSCFQAALGAKIEANQALALCRGADSNYPVTCVQEMSQTLSADQALKLCAEASNKTPNCFYLSVSFLTSPQAVELCGGAKNLEPIACFNYAKKTLEADVAASLCHGAK